MRHWMAREESAMSDVDELPRRLRGMAAAANLNPIQAQWCRDAAQSLEQQSAELRTERVLRDTWTKAAEDLAAQRDKLRAALKEIADQNNLVLHIDMATTLSQRARAAIAEAEHD